MAVAALPGVLTAYFAADSGGYFPGAPALVAAELFVVLAVYLALSSRPFGGFGPGLLAAGIALGGFAAWTLASSGWSDAPARALPEYTRALCYLAALLLFGLMPFSAKRIRWMAGALALAVVAVCTLSFLSRTAPDLIDGVARQQPDRLSYPLDYWNALGVLAGLGIILCGHFTCASRERPAVRVAAAAAIPVLTSTLYLTFSRGASWSALVGVGAYLVVARPRGLVGAALATVPTTAVALMAVNPADAITRYPRLSEDAISTGHRTALVVLACMIAAGAIRAAAFGLDKRVEAMRLAPSLGRRALVGVGVASLLLVLVGAAAFHAPSVVADKYRTFKSEDTAPGGSGSSRLLSSSDNGRLEHWRVALDGFEQDRLRGSGAGTYQLLWARERPSTVFVHDGHSLYVETLGELGLVGLSLVGISVLLVLFAFARRARGPDRELFGALLAAGIAWALAASVDWVWEMPAITLWLFALGGAALARRAPTPEAGPRPGRWRAGALVIRGAAVAVCLLLALLPGRLAISQAHVESSIDRMHEGDCRGARAEARRSLDFVAERAAPHHIIAWCRLKEGHPRAAVAELAEARRRDPDNWVLVETDAVARAAAGLDPRAALSRATRLNPRNDLTHAAAATLAHRSRRARIRLAGEVPIPLPELGQP